MSKISVLLCESEDARFTAYCLERGFKKSTLIARLVREHLDGEGFTLQQNLLLTQPGGEAGSDGTAGKLATRSRSKGTRQ